MIMYLKCTSQRHVLSLNLLFPLQNKQRYTQIDAPIRQTSYFSVKLLLISLKAVRLPNLDAS